MKTGICNAAILTIAMGMMAEPVSASITKFAPAATNGVTTHAPRDLRHCLKLDSNYAIAKCANAGRVHKKLDFESIYLKLDQLQAQGVGMAPERPKTGRWAPEEKDTGKFMTGDELRAKQARMMSDYAERTNRENAKNAAELSNIVKKAEQTCGGKMTQFPVIGMTDEYFRMCTSHARFGGIKQAVVSQSGTIPLRLYVFGYNQPKRVYSVNGVITAIKAE
jgi:Skp family chaperone for outer membrane proteins